jgi:hypothetical protein
VGKSSKNKKAKGPFTGIAGHSHNKTKLSPPLASYPALSMIDWSRDLLPEYLWLDLLAQHFGPSIWASQFNRLLDALQTLVDEKTVMTGLISSFTSVPESSRSRFLDENYHLALDTFYRPAGYLLRFYPSCPAAWLCDDRFAAEVPTPGQQDLADKLTSSVVRLLPGKDLYVGDLRTLPYSRYVNSRRIQPPPDAELLDLMRKYPDRCTDPEKRQVQQHARVTINAMVVREAARWTWARDFWRHNHSVVQCKPYGYVLSPGNVLDDAAGDAVLECSTANAKLAVEYLQDLSTAYHCDLYEPERDEILLGLFSRLSRLYFKLSTDPAFWSRDIAGIMLRCIVDTGITFAFLAKQGTEPNFKDFKTYGEGKQKLLMLHLQDTYPGLESLEGRSAPEIAKTMGGGLTPEVLDIELDNWTKKSARDLAIAAGFEKYYRLAYDPSSADVHGTWMSLDNSNLTRCVQPLHRFHRLPGYFEPPAYLNLLQSVQEFYENCLEVGVASLGFPRPNKPFRSLVLGSGNSGGAATPDPTAPAGATPP